MTNDASLPSNLPRDRSVRGFRTLLALLIGFAVAKAILADPIDPDFFWHIRVADQLLSQGIGPVPDPFSFMSNHTTWTPFSWLGELAMRWTFNAWGLRGVVGVHALCSAIFLTFIALSSLEATRQLTGAPRRLATIVAVGFGMLLSLSFLSFRPVTMALALMSVMTWLLWRDRRTHDRAVWLVVPLTVMLTNLHLYVILFVGAMVAWTVGLALDAWTTRDATIRVRRAAVLTTLCALAACATPMLPGCVRNAIWFRSEDPMVAHRLVAEIGPFYDGTLGKVLLGCVLLLVIGAFRARRTLGFANLFTLAAGLVFLFQMGRFSTVFALLACPLVAVVLPARGLRDDVLGWKLVRFAMMTSLLVVAGQLIHAFPKRTTTMDAWLTRNGDTDNLRYPTAAAAYVEAAIPSEHGRVLNELTWGGYLIWRIGDRFQVFMDGRTLIYPAKFWNDLFVNGDASRLAVLKDQQADAAILPVGKSVLREPLLSLGWREVYRDDRAVVLLPPEPVEAVTDAK